MSGKREKIPRIVICASIFTCYDYQGEETGDISHMKRVSAVLVPVSVKPARDGATLFSWACSKGQVCFSETCRYAKGDQYVTVERT